MNADLARAEADLINVFRKEENAVVQARRDQSQLRNVDRPLYDLLAMTKDSTFTARSKERHRPNVALPVTNEYMLGDLPRLSYNNEESRIQDLLI